MKIALDTNVFISGILFHGPPAKILKAWKSSEIQIILSKEILLEYQRVADSLAEKLLILKALKCSSVKNLMTTNFLNVPLQTEPG